MAARRLARRARCTAAESECFLELRPIWHVEQLVVVEVQSVEQSVAAAATWDSLQNTRGGNEKLVLLLDNMGAAGASDVQRALSKAGLRRCCILEGSGGVFLESLGDWSESGVDLVSSSALNRGITPLDMSMLIGRGE